MFIINWLFDKLGYMPKITVDAKFEAWPFPAVSEDFEPRKEKNDSSAKKPAVKKATTRKPKAAVVAKTARTKKVK